jgi:hypothetical protein
MRIAFWRKRKKTLAELIGVGDLTETSFAFRRKKIDHESQYGLTEDEYNRLARFNGERDHGVVHTDAYRQRMAQLQIQYNRHMGMPAGYRYYMGGSSAREPELLHDTTTDGPLPDHLKWLGGHHA